MGTGRARRDHPGRHRVCAPARSYQSVAAREGVRRYTVAPAAENDLALIFDYIAQRNPDAADRVMDALVEAFDRLADHPKLGHRRTDLTARPVRFWSVRDYLIVYRGEEHIEICAFCMGGAMLRPNSLRGVRRRDPVATETGSGLNATPSKAVAGGGGAAGPRPRRHVDPENARNLRR